MHVLAAVLIVAGITLRTEAPAVFPTFLILGTLFVIIAFSFRQLRIRGEGEWLAIRFRPLPLCWKRFAYAERASADPDNTRWIDGWGIHWIARARTPSEDAYFAALIDAGADNGTQ